MELLRGLALGCAALEFFGAIGGLVAPARAQSDAAARGAAGEILATEFGPIRGTRLEGARSIRVWKAIPFAAPPSGALRWQPPRDPAAWTEERDGTRFGAACPQPSIGIASRGVAEQSEDCLHLNVWAPERREGEPPLPILVWIHGGGLVIGAAGLPYYDGSAVAREGAIVVSIQYRLGPLGFFAHPALVAESGPSIANAGLLDQIHALRWVQRHAERLGGDPERVTVFGESAGALSISCLLVSPLARGLFQRAILQSGTATGARLPTLEEAQRAARELEDELGVRAGSGDVEVVRRLRSIDAAELIVAVKPGIDARQGTRWRALVDGVVLPDQPSELFARGEFARVPILIGANSGDGSVFSSQWPVRTKLGWNLALRGLLGAERAARVLELYPWDEADPEALIERFLTEQAFVAPARRAARDVARHGGAAWLYHYDYVSTARAARRSTAPHGSEIPLLFDYRPLGVVSDADARVGAALRAAWLRFAASGAPVESEADWPKASASANSAVPAMYFRAETALGEAPAREACDLWDAIGFAERGR